MLAGVGNARYVCVVHKKVVLYEDRFLPSRNNVDMAGKPKPLWGESGREVGHPVSTTG